MTNLAEFTECLLWYFRFGNIGLWDFLLGLSPRPRPTLQFQMHLIPPSKIRKMSASILPQR